MSQFCTPYEDNSTDDVDIKKQRAKQLAANGDLATTDGVVYNLSGNKMLTIVAFVIFVIIILASNSNAADKMVIVGATSDGMAIWEKAPNYDSLRIHYLDIVSTSMEKLSSDSLDQETAIYNITNIALQSVFANRLPKMITPYNMVCLFTSDYNLRFKLVMLINNSVWLRQKNAVIVLEDNRRFNLVEGQWNYITSEAEIRPVNYNELICLVMGIDYVAPEPVEHIVVAEVVPEKKRSLPGYSTVDP